MKESLVINEEEKKEEEKKEEEKKEEEKKENEKEEKKENEKKDNGKKPGDEVWFGITILGRIIMTTYSFHAVFFIYNILIQFIFLVPGLAYETDKAAVHFIVWLLYIFFGIFTSNILIIPAYDFFLFPYLNFRNPLYHLESLFRVKKCIENKSKSNLDENDKSQKEKKNSNIDEKEKNRNNNYMNFFLILIEVFYSIGFLASSKLKDYTKLIILSFNYFYHLFLFIGHIMISIYLIHKFRIDNSDSLLKKIFKYNFDEFFKNRGPLPNISLFSYIYHPILKKSYNPKTDENNEIEKEHFEDHIYRWKHNLRIIFCALSSILVIIYLCETNAGFLPRIIYCLFYVAMLCLSFIMNFPFIVKNRKTFGYYPKGKIKFLAEYRLRHTNIVLFLRFFFTIFNILVVYGLIKTFYSFKDSDDTLDLLLKKKIISQKQSINIKNLLLPNICFSSIHNIPIYLFMPFINDAYYYNDHLNNSNNYNSSLDIQSYKELFFDDSYKIKCYGNLINQSKEEAVKMIQFNVENSKNKVTILSIKGTSNKKDIYIDIQLYFPSVLLNLLSTFSFMEQRKELLSFKFTEYSLSIPYRLFFHYSIINDYLNDLRDAFKQHRENFFGNIIITGHSLGGGLAKLLGRLENKQAIALSGPGINAFHNLWGYEGYSENFEISGIDLVPDMDLVPRVEISGGTVYRIICKNGVFNCHSKVRSLCEVLIMCKNPNRYEYCKNIAEISDSEIEDIEKSSELNFKYQEE